MAAIHEGGCLCGAVRYHVVGEPDPTLTGVCHCTNCQRRTGSAFGISVYFVDTDDIITQGELKSYTYRSDESYRWAKMEFCPTCGTTVTWTAEAAPGFRALAGGTFDNPNWFTLSVHVWTRSAQRWMVYPPGVQIQEKGDTM
jgi:hypothetical protein